MLLLGSAFAGAIAVFVAILRGFLWASIYFDLVEKHIVRPPDQDRLIARVDG